MCFEFEDSEYREKIFNKGKSTKVNPAGMRKYFEWRRLIRDGDSPQDAARAVGDTHYEQLKGKTYETYSLYSIRLSQSDRVTFIYPSSSRIKIVGIGGHY
jgi:plasmid maintenance system killer protein